ncbi:MAG: peptidoglycan bridge formation glycyltransferase FemA/FemB family protein [Desulfobacteraceae bacterium]|nr:MAG: peptidoglycan bridge formation glycyltransferase FemA/FemB family protein [Desulfobacteraceae bacterium]
MHLEVFAHADSNWTDKIDRFGGNLFHTPQWADSRRSAASRALFFQLYDARRDCLGIALGIEMWSPLPVIGRYSKQLEFETYPAVQDDREELVHAMMKQIISHARGRGFRRVVFNSYLTRTFLKHPGDMGLKTKPRIEFIIDLTRSDSQLFSGFSAHHKRKIKKARKHDLVFCGSQDPQAMRQFRQLQKRSRDRRLERGENMAVREDGYYEELGKRYFAADLGTVFMLTCDGRPVSAAFVAHYGPQALYMYGGSNDLGFEMDAPILLFSHIFSCCRERGRRIFNLGGVPEEARQPEAQSHGLFRFKEGFGGAQRICLNAVADNLNPGRDKLLNLFKRLLRPKVVFDAG